MILILTYKFLFFSIVSSNWRK